jgi:phosphatidate cytidylyltransferase
MTRIASAAVLLAVLFGTLLWAPAWATVALAAIFAAAAAAELALVARSAAGDVSPWFLGAAAATICVAFTWRLDFALVVLAAVLAAGSLTLAGGPPSSTTIARAALMLMGPVYVGVPLGAVASIRLTSGAGQVLLLILIVAASDSAQYYTGRMFGRHKLAPAVSPAKTVEGAIGGLVFATIAGAVAGPRLSHIASLTPPVGALIGLLVAAFGIVGDLFESLLKRSAGVKDSSALIPGHGGVLDRVDSYLFAAPCFYIALTWLP